MESRPAQTTCSACIDQIEGPRKAQSREGWAHAAPHDRLTLSARMLACTMITRKIFTSADLQLHVLNVTL